MRSVHSHHAPHHLWRRSNRAVAAALLMALAMLLTGHGAVRAQSNAVYTLTNEDNGSTIHAAVGDTVQLKLTPIDDVWSEDVVQNPAGMFFRPPFALVRGIQNLWQMRMAGTATINATGNPSCYPQCLAPSVALSFTVVVGDAQQGVSVSYQPGWNLVGVPAGTKLPVEADAWDPANARYSAVAAGTPLEGGQGYWAYFTTSTSVPLSTPQILPARREAPAGAWVMVGNPSPATPASVGGADAVFAWNPAAGAYETTARLQPGQGAWAISLRGGTITVSPVR
jgi:hypothetical protein